MAINPSQPLSAVPDASHCVYCGAVTALYDRGRPICIRCAGREDTGEKLTKSNLQDIRAELLITRLDAALMLMSVAATSDIQEMADFFNHKARHTYDNVLQCLANLTPDAQQGTKINEKMSLLKRRLQAVGQF